MLDMQIIHYKYGSLDSKDIDVITFVEDISDTDSYRKLSFYMKQQFNLEVNFCVLKDGYIVDSSKGIPQSVNNSLYWTFGIHEYNRELVNPVKSLYPIDQLKILKSVEAVRTCLSFISRTEFRSLVKPSLSSRDMDKRIKVLRNIDYFLLTKELTVDQLKSMSFVIGQAYCLLRDIENVFTKQEVYKFLPELQEVLQRQGDFKNNLKIFNDLKNNFLDLLVKEYIIFKKENPKDCNNHNNIITSKENKIYKICLLKERLKNESKSS